ncbi:MAG: DMT family transporter [Mycobacteriales bacterium]
MISSTPLLAVLLWFIWGGTFLAVKVGLETTSPGMFGLLRVAAAGVVLAVVVVFLRPSDELRVFRRPSFLWTGALLGLTNVAGLIAFTHVAMVRAEAGFSAVVVYAQPFLVSLVAHYAFHEPLTTRKTLGLVAGWSGVVVVVSGHLFDGHVSLGTVGLLLAAAASWTTGTLLFKSLSPEVPVWPVLLWQNAVGAVPLGALALLEPTRVAWGGTLVFALLVAGVGAGVAGFGLQFLLLRRGAASAVGSWIFAVPVVSSGLSIAFLGEAARPTLLVGIVAVAAGIYLVNRPTRPAPRAPATAGAP